MISPSTSTILAQLEIGRHVELCDTTTTIQELNENPDVTSIAVIVAGVGCGRIHKPYLTQIEDTQYDQAPRSYLTTLEMTTTLGIGRFVNPQSTIASNLPVFGPSVTHLRAFQQAITISPREIALGRPRLEHLETVVTTSPIPQPDTVPPMPNLRFIGIKYTHRLLDNTFQLLRVLATVHSIRLRFVQVHQTEDAWNMVKKPLLELFKRNWFVM